MIDYTKPVQTRDGRPVTILSTEGRGQYPVIGYVGKDTAMKKWSAEGNYSTDGDRTLDLINVPDRIECWVNVYPEHFSSPHESKEQADSVAEKHRIACIKVEYTVGDGLE